MDTVAPFVIIEDQYLYLRELRDKFSHRDGRGIDFIDYDRDNQSGALPPSAVVVWRAEDRPTGRDIEELRNFTPFIRLIVVLGRTSPISLRDAFAAGVRGCLTDDMTLQDIKQAVQTVKSGGIYLPARDKAPTAPDTPAQPLADPSALTEEMTGLTPGQRRVLELLCRGYANKEIAHALGISVGTVKNHVTAILGALRVQTRQQLIVKFGQATV